MLTAMTEDDWAIVLQAFRAVRSRRGDKARYRERRGKNREFPDQFVWIAVGRIGFEQPRHLYGHGQAENSLL